MILLIPEIVNECDHMKNYAKSSLNISTPRKTHIGNYFLDMLNFFNFKNIYFQKKNIINFLKNKLKNLLECSERSFYLGLACFQ
jgi:hypothetical protein